MKSPNSVICASLLTLAISTSAMAGNIGGLKTTSAGNIGGLRTNSVGNIGGVRASDPVAVTPTTDVPDLPPSRVQIGVFENLGSFLSILISVL